MAPMLEGAIRGAAQAFKLEAEREAQARSGAFPEPPLPERRAAGPLAGLEPIRIVG